VINRFDKPNTFFYLDPPYYGNEKEYGDGIFYREDSIKLATLLKGLEGKFILSINDHPKTREIFNGFRISRERMIYTAGHTQAEHKLVTELLISNYLKREKSA
jgi:DNA adenine methylase